MALQIEKAAGLGLTQQVSEKQKVLSKTIEKMGTGKKINRAQDDAAGLAVAKLLEAMSRGYKADAINIGDAMSAMNIAEGATSNISGMMDRMYELSTQAANDTLNDSDRRALNDEFQQLKQEIERQARATEFNTQDVISGQSALSDGTGKFQVGPNAGDENRIDVAKADLRPEMIGIMNMDISSSAGATAAIDGIGKAKEIVLSSRVGFGVQYNRLEHAYNNNENLNVNTTAAMSLIEDLDFAKASMEKAKDEILGQSAVLAQRNFQEISRNSMLALLGQN